MYWKDIEEKPLKDVDFLHICYPYTERFIEQTRSYIDIYKPEITVIHSTVPVGTTAKVGEDVIHSPIRGKHPNISKGIWTFHKFIGGRNRAKVIKIAHYFKKAKMKTWIFDKPETTELAKILCTSYYGWNIVFCKEAKKICDQYGLSFSEVYGVSNDTYNLGWARLGETKYIRPNLDPVPGKIGGHCIVQNCDLLDSKVTKLIKEFNEEYSRETNPVL